jgi:hypothetical protein
MIAGGGAALGAPEHGAEIAASGPAFKSVPGYIEIFSGPSLGRLPQQQLSLER